MIIYPGDVDLHRGALVADVLQLLLDLLGTDARVGQVLVQQLGGLAEG